MNTPIRSILALAVLVVVLAACGTTVGAPASEAPSPSQPAVPSVEPSATPSEAPTEPSEPAAEEREIAGTITVAEGMAFSGPGGTIQESLDNGPQGDLPSLVNGVLFRDIDGRIYLASALGDAATPTFDAPMLEVLNMDSDGPEWDMTSADLLGLVEANGIVFKQNAQVLGYLELP